MPDQWLTFELRRTGDTGTLTHGTQQTPVRGIRKAEDGALCFEAQVDVEWEALLARLFSRVVG